MTIPRMSPQSKKEWDDFAREQEYRMLYGIVKKNIIKELIKMYIKKNEDSST